MGLCLITSAVNLKSIQVHLELSQSSVVQPWALWTNLINIPSSAEPVCYIDPSVHHVVAVAVFC